LTLKSSRNPALTITLSDIDPNTTTISQLRESVQSELGGSTIIAAEKIKILRNKKPVPASKKTVGNALEGETLEKGKTVEMGVMVLGGAPDPPAKTGPIHGGDAAPVPPLAAPEVPAPAAEKMDGIEKASLPPPVQGPSGKEILETEEFWTDMQGYLEQRIKSESEAVRLVQKWKSNWKED
jgi:ubiquitin-like protein 4